VNDATPGISAGDRSFEIPARSSRELSPVQKIPGNSPVSPTNSSPSIDLSVMQRNMLLTAQRSLRPFAGELFASLIRSLAGLRLSPSARHLSALLSRLPVNLERRRSPVSQLKRAAGGSGLRRLKEMLVRLSRDQLTVGDDRQAAKTIRDILRLLQSQQVINARLRETAAAYIQIPFVMDGRMQTMELRVNRDQGGKRGSGRGPGFSMSMVLTTASLGVIRVDMTIISRLVQARILTSSERVNEFVSSRTQLLTSLLKNAGYECAKPSCEVYSAASGEEEYGRVLSRLDIRI